MTLGSKKKTKYKSFLLKTGTAILVLMVFLLPISSNASTLERNICTVIGMEKPNNFYLYSPALESAVYGSSTITSPTRFSLSSSVSTISSLTAGHYIATDYESFTLLYDYVYTIDLVFSLSVFDFNLSSLSQEYVSNYELALYYGSENLTSVGFKPDLVTDLGYGKYKLTYNVMLNSASLNDLPFAFTENGIAYYTATGFYLYNSGSLPDGMASFIFAVEALSCNQLTNADIILNTPIDNSDIQSGLDSAQNYDVTIDEFVSQVDISTFSDDALSSFFNYNSGVFFVGDLMELLYNSFEIYYAVLPVLVLLSLYCWLFGFRK